MKALLAIVIGVIGMWLFVTYAIDRSDQVAEEVAEQARSRNLTPEQRHAETLRTCAKSVDMFRFKLATEMSEFDRRMLYYCELQLEHPDQNIIK
jgi:hypothetical protein